MTASGDGFFAVLSPAEIYRQLTQGRGIDSLAGTQNTLHRELPEEEDRAGLIAAIGELIATGWQGETSAAALGAALPLREHVLANADLLDRAQDLVSRQVGSFETAHNSVRPVSEAPEQPLDDPFPFDADHEKQVTGYQADAQHNIAVFRDYDGASEYNETNMPRQFHAGGRDSGPVSVTSPDAIEVGEPGPGSGGGPPGGDGPRGADTDGRPVGGRGSPGTGGPGASGNGPAGVLPAGVGTSGDAPGGGGSGGPQTTPSEHRFVPPPSSLPGQGFPVSGSPGGVPLAGAPGGGGGGGRSGMGGGSAGSWPRSGGAGNGGGAGPVVRGPGVGAGALAAEEGAVRRGAQAAAAGRGAGPMGAPAGAGRGKDDEDAEHERKVLIEADPEETFGSDVLTAPQVIGDDEYED